MELQTASLFEKIHRSKNAQDKDEKVADQV
jgi:hypothetical protein